jgi:single-strand DNA-binding protein
MGVNINRVTITGNLTADPDLRSLNSGTAVCSLRVAVNGRRKNASGEWEDKPNYFTVTVWGAQGENCNRFLSKGRPVAIDGRLDWREWQDNAGNKRQSVEIVADTVQFLGDGQGGGDRPPPPEDPGFTPRDDPSFGQPAPAASGYGQPPAARTPPPDDDIPFVARFPEEWEDRYEHGSRW